MTPTDDDTLLDNKVVQVALEHLTPMMNGNNGVWGSAEEVLTKSTLNLLGKRGERLVGRQIEQWCVASEWDERAAKEFGKWADRVQAGSKLRPNPRAGFGIADSAYEAWVEEARSRFAARPTT